MAVHTAWSKLSDLQQRRNETLEQNNPNPQNNVEHQAEAVVEHPAGAAVDV